MSGSFVVRLRGGSYRNQDGSDRQALLAACRRDDPLQLQPEPENPHDRHAVAVLDGQGRQLGYLPSDARDASSLLRGQRISARVEKVLGGPRWWHQLFGIKRSYGLLIRLDKGSEDWAAFNQARSLTEPVDALVTQASYLEKSGADPEVVVSKYIAAINAVIDLNCLDRSAAAHRYQPAPINRLTMLLVRLRRGDQAFKYYSEWVNSRDPIGIPKADRDALSKRMLKVAAQQNGQGG